MPVKPFNPTAVDDFNFKLNKDKREARERLDEMEKEIKALKDEIKTLKGEKETVNNSQKKK